MTVNLIISIVTFWITGDWWQWILICFISDPTPVRLRLQSQPVFSSPPVQSQSPSNAATRVNWQNSKSVWQEIDSGKLPLSLLIVTDCFCLFQHSLHGDSSCYCSTGSPVFTGYCCRIQRPLCRPAACLQTGTEHRLFSPSALHHQKKPSKVCFVSICTFKVQDVERYCSHTLQHFKHGCYVAVSIYKKKKMCWL